VPAARETGVQRHGAIDQRNHRADILAEDPQREPGLGKYGRVVAMRLQGASSEIDTFAAVRLRIVAMAVNAKPHMAIRSPGQRRPVARIACDGLFEEGKRIRDLRARRQDHFTGTQIEVVGGQIGRRAACRTGGLGRLQCRFDYSGDADRNLVLQLEHVFEEAVEAIGREMGAGFSLDQCAVIRTRLPDLRTEPSSA
jgi:hypothetical protein